MEKEISESLTLAKALIQGTDHFVAVLDRRGVILEVSEAVARVVGRSRLSLAGSPGSDIFPSTVASSRMTVFERVKESGRGERFEDEIQGRFFDQVIYPILGTDGKTDKVVVVGIDITERRRAEKEVLNALDQLQNLEKERSHFLSDILEQAADGICVCHNTPEAPYVRFTHWNRRMTDITGYSINEINELGWYQTMYPDPEYQSRAVERMVEMREGKDIYAEEWVVAHKNGQRRTLSISTSVLKREDGSVHVLAMMQDVTDRKQVEAAREAIRGHVEYIQQIARIGDWEWDIETDIMIWSREMYCIFGLCPEKGTPSYELVKSLVHPDDLMTLEEAVDKAVRESDQLKLDYRAIRSDGSVVWVHNEARILRRQDGKAFKVIGTIQDVTDRKEAEEALRASEQRYKKLSDELEMRVQERTVELENKTRELQEFNFVASHDLSEPLRKIQTFGDLLKARSEDHLSKQERDYVSRMTEAANRMQELLDALLRYSRIETQARDLVPVKLDDIVRTVNTDLEVSLRKTRANVEIGSLPSINGDPYQWRQVFQNLVANAIKYQRSEVKPRIRIFCEQNERRFQIFVEDNGIGFDEKHLDKIFQPFQRLHGRNEYPGTGIGLAICKKIVERHGGSITAKSTPGKGSTFILTLPGTPAR